MLANNICCYVDTALLGQMLTWNLDGVTGKVATYDGRPSGTIDPAGNNSGSGSGNTTPAADPENP